MLQQDTPWDGWHITPDATNDEAYPIFKQDPILNCFALADLLPPFRQYTRIAIASHPQTAREASLLIVEHPQIKILSTAGNGEGMAALLANVDLPASTVIQVPSQHWWLLHPYYTLPPKMRLLRRMALSAQTFQRPAQGTLPVAERMTKEDLPELRALYTLFPTGHFRPELIDEGLFYGVRLAQRLVAAGGTHVLALPYSLAVLGNIFTHPEHRERGCAQAVVDALVTDLLAQGCRDIILNVDVDNPPAIHVYTKLGFQPHCDICVGPAQRR
jgi:ribosomal protein S18 acetylase RimI-like enzyme